MRVDWLRIGLGCLVLLALPEFSWALASPQKVFTLRGKVLNEKNAPLLEATCTISGGLLPAEGLTVKTDYQGEFRFLQLPSGTYTLTCAAMGYQPVTKTIELKQAPPYLEVVLPPEIIVREKVEVRAKAPTVSQGQGAPPVILNSQEIMDLPIAEQKFQAALPLIPGVIRTPDGRINIKGVPENQGLLLVNSAEAVDPVTGSFSIGVPIQDVESLQVYKNAYDAEYGGFSGGLTTLYTKPPASGWHFETQDFVPNPRIKAGHLVGIADVNPKFYVTGPLLANRLNFSEAVVYDLDKQPVRGLAWPHNEIKTHDFNSFSSLQCIFSSTHILTVNANVFPLVRQFADINSLVPQPASSDYGQKGFSLGATDRYLASSGSAFTTLIQATQFDSNGHGQGPSDMLVTPNGWGGDFFNAFRRYSDEEEIQETYNHPQLEWYGRQDVILGGGLFRRAFEGSSQSHPVRLFRSDGTLAERIDFSGAGNLQAQDSDGFLFAQDNWAVTDQLSVDLGLRYTGQTLGSLWNFAPRLGVAYSPGVSGKTVIRGGFGVFFDRPSLLAGDFPNNPVRQVGFFDTTGSPQGSLLVFQNVYGSGEEGKPLALSTRHLNSTPYNTSWSLEADRELRPNAVLRVSFVSSRTYDQFIVDPQPALASGPALVLTNLGGSGYHEFETTLHTRLTADTEWNISYVNSRARGDLNVLSQIYVPFEQPVIRPDAYTNLPSDIPHRLITWGQAKTHVWGILASPVLDWHSGFPYAVVDELQNYVGPPNTKRFPRFLSLDLKLSKEFRLPFPWIKNHVLRGALTILNVTNNSNPRDIYNNITSPFFGHYVGFQHYFFDTNIEVLY